MVALQDVATIHAGGRLGFSGNDFIATGVPAYGAGGKNGYVETPEYKDQNAIILSSIGARCGKCFLAEGSWTTLANTQVIVPDETRVNARFLWHQLNDESRWPRSGSAQPFIKPSDVKAHRVWMPPLSEQQRIANILDTQTLLCEQRRRSLKHLDLLIESIYHDTFAHPGESWPVRTIGEIAMVKGGKRLPKGAEYAPHITNHAYIRVSDMRAGAVDAANLRYLSAETQRAISRYTVASGDVIISIAGTIGLIAPIPPGLAGANLTENAAKIVASSSDVYLSEWLADSLRSEPMQAQIRGQVGQVTIGKLALFRIEGLRLRVPPIAVQASYLERIRPIHTLRSTYLEQSEHLTAMTTSLRKRAFGNSDEHQL